MMRERLASADPRIQVTLRTRVGLLYYLGELVAAQNYSEPHFEPSITVGTSRGYRNVPLFKVKRGTLEAAGAAVTASYNGEAFYIPRSAFGSPDEARSLQVLDLVSQVVVLRYPKGEHRRPDRRQISNGTPYRYGTIQRGDRYFVDTLVSAPLFLSVVVNGGVNASSVMVRGNANRRGRHRHHSEWRK